MYKRDGSLSINTFKKYKKHIAPDTCKHAGSQAERRLEANKDPCTHISLAAVLPAILLSDDVGDSNCYDMNTITKAVHQKLLRL